MRNNIKILVVASISVIGLLFTQACKKDSTVNQAPAIEFADELQPEPGDTYVMVDSGMPIHIEFTATDDRGLASGTVHVFTSSGQTLYDTTLTLSGQTTYLFHQHYYPAAVSDTTYASVAVMVTDNDNAMAMDTALVEILP